MFEGTGVKAFGAPCVKAIVLEGGAGFTRSRLDALTDRAKALGAKGLAWFRVTGGGRRRRPSTRRSTGSSPTPSGPACWPPPGPSAGDLVLVVADEYRLACTVLGQLRVELGGRPVCEGPYRYLWVVDFPLFDGVDDAGHPVAAHHPFTMPHPDDLDRLESDPASVRSQAYDLVLNGWELGSGSVRIHRGDIQSRVFSVLGHRRGGGAVPVRLPARCLPLRGSAPRRVRRRASTGWWPSSPARTASAR